MTKPKSIPVTLKVLDAAMAVHEHDPYGWTMLAACAGIPKNIFYPERGDATGLDTAIAVCESCPVRVACLAAGLYEEPGVWGGTTARARKTMRREYAVYLREKAA